MLYESFIDRLLFGLRLSIDYILLGLRLLSVFPLIYKLATLGRQEVDLGRIVHLSPKLE